MTDINFNNFKCRCSAISKILSNSRQNPQLTEKQAEKLKELQQKEILTEKQGLELAELLVKSENSSKVILSDTCIEYLMEWYAETVEGKLAVEREAMDIDAMSKGKRQEDESITLISIVEGYLYQKNDIRVFNDYLTGEPDMFLGENIYAATHVKDNKAIWDRPIFLKKIAKPVENTYICQLKGYGDITTAHNLEVTNTLVNMPEDIIFKYKEKFALKMGVIDQDSPSFIREWNKWENSMRFDDIPKNQRVFRQKIEPFTDFERTFLYDRVKVCREYLFNFHETLQTLNIKPA